MIIWCLYGKFLVAYSPIVQYFDHLHQKISFNYHKSDLDTPIWSDTLTVPGLLSDADVVEIQTLPWPQWLVVAQGGVVLQQQIVILLTILTRRRFLIKIDPMIHAACHRTTGPATRARYLQYAPPRELFANCDWVFTRARNEPSRRFHNHGEGPCC